MDNDQLRQQAIKILGDQISAWWTSDIGKFIIGRSLQETSEVRSKLTTVDPEDSKAIRELQTEIKIAEKALIWMQEAINEAKQQLEIDHIEQE